MRSILLAAAIAAAPAAASACSACGCMLTSDFSSEGLFAQPGLRLDLRYDHIDQKNPAFGHTSPRSRANPASAGARDRAAHGQQLCHRQP